MVRREAERLESERGKDGSGKVERHEHVAGVVGAERGKRAEKWAAEAGERGRDRSVAGEREEMRETGAAAGRDERERGKKRAKEREGNSDGKRREERKS
jgi:hypothetical protein